MTTLIPDGTVVVISRNLGRVIRARRYGGADGYDVSAPIRSPRDEGHAPHFAPDWCTVPAVLGETVCRTPWGKCWCGLLHVSALELAWLPPAGQDGTEAGS
jgi:hypothetical protein